MKEFIAFLLSVILVCFTAACSSDRSRRISERWITSIPIVTYICLRFQTPAAECHMYRCFRRRCSVLYLKKRQRVYHEKNNSYDNERDYDDRIDDGTVDRVQYKQEHR